MAEEPEASDRRERSFWRDNGLSLALAALFLLCVGAQCITGYLSINTERSAHGLPALAVGAYLMTGTFLDGMFVNLQAAFLQLAVLITFSAFLEQRGAAHSRKPAGERSARRPDGRPVLPDGSRDRRELPRHRGWLYRNSLSLAFIGLFLLFFALHVWFGVKQTNELASLTREPRVEVMDYAISSRFWFSNFQTWQAEFFAICAYVLLSIFLRQARSSESKPEDAPDSETGVTNE